ncbi:MAG: hypothetical protein CVU99_09220 [Firmicutes bacterium HGW-Firmicutes-4]|nr:MAG: hypothetical protein CVU99_09220 [Firmicutes bacterium HGW-Firmicutes-4]
MGWWLNAGATIDFFVDIIKFTKNFEGVLWLIRAIGRGYSYYGDFFLKKSKKFSREKKGVNPFHPFRKMMRGCGRLITAPTNLISPLL